MVSYYYQEQSPNFKELSQKFQELWTKIFGGGLLRPPGLNGVNYSNGKFPLPPGKLYSKFPTPRAVQSGKSPTQPGGTLRVSLDSPININKYALINRAGGPCEEIFVMTFKAYIPNEVRCMPLECQNKYFLYGPESRLTESFSQKLVPLNYIFREDSQIDL